MPKKYNKFLKISVAVYNTIFCTIKIYVMQTTSFRLLLPKHSNHHLFLRFLHITTNFSIMFQIQYNENNDIFMELWKNKQEKMPHTKYNPFKSTICRWNIFFERKIAKKNCINSKPILSLPIYFKLLIEYWKYTHT